MLRDSIRVLLVLLISLEWRSFTSAFLSARPKRRPLMTTTLEATTAPTSPTLTDHAPSWDSMEQQLLETDTGRQLHELKEARQNGHGPPSAHARLRLFDDETNESNVRVTVYRDSAAWCVYCQKVWIFLEERQIPYRVKTVPLNAYGDKPAWYSRLVDGGKVPAIELDGKVYTESLDIIKLLDQTFARHTNEKLEEELLQLETKVQQDWFSLVFYPVEGDALQKAREIFLETMSAVDEHLGLTPGPWFGGPQAEPSIIDILYIPMMERIEASVLYWRNMRLRDKFHNIDTWLNAWEQRPSYMATKSDHYSLCLAIPSQNGPGYFSPDAKDVAAKIYGLDGAWELGNDASIEPVNVDDNTARTEAVHQLVENHERIVEFCARAAGEPGTPTFHAELSDPYAEPNEYFISAIDICLRHVANALMSGADSTKELASDGLRGICVQQELQEGWEANDEDDRTYYWNYETGDVAWTPPTGQLDSCLAYLRDRVGVPRDMSFPAARQLRMHLNWAIAIMKEKT